MEANHSLKLFPGKRVKPYDGMAVTADVWAQAHGEHRSASRAHNYFFHGSGILTGLEVIANDPPDRCVSISPGVAVDQVGNVIVIPERVAFDFGDHVHGTLYLLLGYGSHEEGGKDNGEKFEHESYMITAHPAWPGQPAVELARITLHGTKKPILNAVQQAHPQYGEIDLRFRSLIMPPLRQPVHVGLIDLGDYMPEVAAGWDFLSRACQQLSYYSLAVDTGLTLYSNLIDYDFISISSCGSFQLDAGQRKSLRAYLDTRKMMFCESIDAAAHLSFNNIFEDLGRPLTSLDPKDHLLTTPFLFNTPPRGFNPAHLSHDKQILYSRAAYSLAWTGQLLPEHRTRADIRSAHEWGVNIISWLLHETEEQRRGNGRAEQLSIGG